MATRAFLLCGDEKAVHAVTQILDELELSFEHSSEPAFTLKRLAAQKFDLLIVDCDNIQNATQVFNSARASNLNKNSIAIAIVEGKAGVPNAFRLGASLVLTKPVALEQVRNTLRTGVGMTRKDAPEPKTPASFVPAIASSGRAPAGAKASSVSTPAAPAAPAAAGVPPSPAPRTAPVAGPTPTVMPPVTASESPTKVSVVAPPAAPKPAPVVPRPPAAGAVAESKPAATAEDSKPAPALAAQTLMKAAAAAAGAAPAKSNFDSIFAAPPASGEALTGNTSKKADKPGELEELKSALGPSAKLSEPAPEDGVADLDPDDDLGVPSFGGMGRQPFGGEEAPRNRGSRGGLVAALLLVVVGGAGYGAWATQPGVRKFVAWEYLNLSSKVAAIRGQAPASTPAPSAAQAPVAAAAAPVTEPAAATPDPNAGANLAASTQAVQPATTAPADPVQKTAAVQPARQDTTPSHAGSNPALVAASASIPPTTATKSTGSDLLEVPEDFADDQVVHRVHPSYPKQARARKLHGTVVLEAVVNKQGKVDSLQLVSGDPLLAQAAADAVKQWRYKPYLHNGEYTEFQTRVTVDFKEPELLKTAR
jgi:protein TonB